jgi:hypothetical protein
MCGMSCVQPQILAFYFLHYIIDLTENMCSAILNVKCSQVMGLDTSLYKRCTALGSTWRGPTWCFTQLAQANSSVMELIVVLI